MTEIGIHENKIDIPKVQDIKPDSQINMNDCNRFWDDIFGKEIDPQDVQVENKSKSNLESAKKFWDAIFSETVFRDDIFPEIVEENNATEIMDEGLTQEDKDLIKKETRWSDEIVDAIRSIYEYKIYKDAGLVEGEVNGKKCLMRTDIDWEQKDQFGSTNRERVVEGYAPLDKTGKPIQLHHIGQHADSPLAELTFKEHRTGGNDTILHDKTKQTEVHGEGNNWDSERKDYWQNRQLDGGERR